MATVAACGGCWPEVLGGCARRGLTSPGARPGPHGCSCRARERAPMQSGLRTQRMQPWPLAPRLSRRSRGSGGRAAPGPRPQRLADRLPPRVFPQLQTLDRGCCAPSRRRWVLEVGAGSRSCGRGLSSTRGRVSKGEVAGGGGGDSHFQFGAHLAGYLPPVELEAGEFGGWSIGGLWIFLCCVRGGCSGRAPWVWGTPGYVWVGPPLVEEPVVASQEGEASAWGC